MGALIGAHFFACTQSVGAGLLAMAVHQVNCAVSIASKPAPTGRCFALPSPTSIILFSFYSPA
jgi:hypothetical protein